MIKVRAKSDERADALVRRFKRICQKEGLANDMRRCAYYLKPSEKRRAKESKRRNNINRNRSKAF